MLLGSREDTGVQSATGTAVYRGWICSLSDHGRVPDPTDLSILGVGPMVTPEVSKEGKVDERK